MSEHKDPVAMVEDSVGMVILKAVLTEIKMLSPRFNAMTVDAQEEVIERLRLQITDQINSAVSIIAAKAYQTVPANVVSVAFKEKTKVTLELADPKNETNRKLALAVADSVRDGGGCMLVLASTEEFTGGMHTVRGTDPQRDWTRGDD